MIRFVPVLALLAVPLLSGCARSKHLTYDFGRAYTESFTSQADLTRPSVAAAQHPLTGHEATQIRLRVEEATTDKETAVIEFRASQ